MVYFCFVLSNMFYFVVIVIGSSIKFHVRTAASDGLLLLAGAESSRNVQSQLNFIAVHVVMGRPHVIVRVSGEEFDMWG